MSDAVWLIWANSAGDPWTGPGRVGHFVRVSDYPGMTIVNEFSDGGKYPHSDCGPACSLSTLADRGQHPSARDVEIADTTGANGTTLEGVSNGLGHFRVTNTWARGNPPAGWIMNPAGGRLISPAEFPRYLAASQGYVVTITAPDPWAKPPSIEGADMVIIIEFAGGEGNYYQVGSMVCPLNNPTDQANLVAACKAAGVPVVTWANVSLAQYADIRARCCTPF